MRVAHRAVLALGRQGHRWRYGRRGQVVAIVVMDVGHGRERRRGGQIRMVVVGRVARMGYVRQGNTGRRGRVLHRFHFGLGQGEQLLDRIGRMSTEQCRLADCVRHRRVAIVQRVYARHTATQRVAW